MYIKKMKKSKTFSESPTINSHYSPDFKQETPSSFFTPKFSKTMQNNLFPDFKYNKTIVKQKEEIKLTFKEENIDEKIIENINSIVKDIEIINKIEDYSQYKKEINNLLKTENKKLLINEIKRMKTLGKIGITKTYFDIKSNDSENIILSNNNCTIYSKENNESIKTNNCIFKGKWCYEVELITNGSFKIGFCNYNTKLKNKFIGHDLTSFSFDGNKNLSFHQKTKNYGKNWDCGDIIGVCIDLENQFIEYYLNGKKLGHCFNNIPVGNNIFYFPALTINKGEKICFNFGQYDFHFNYFGYNIFDMNIDWSVSEKLFNLLEKKLLNVLIEKNLSFYEKYLLFYQIFEYLINVSFNDPFIFKKFGIQFLIRLKNKDQRLLQKFLDLIIDFIPLKENKKKFVFFIIDNISSLIEENSVLADKAIFIWEENIKLFKSILISDNIVNLWFENNEKVMLTLKTIFNSNFFKFTDFYHNIMVQKNYNIPILKAIKVIDHHFFKKKTKEFLYLNSVYCDNISDLIKYFLTEERKFFQGKILKDQFNEFLRIELKPSNEDLFVFLDTNEKISKNQSLIYKNVFYPLFQIFLKEYLDIPFEKLSTEPFFNRDSNVSIYSNDINLGGTINNVTHDYIKTIDKNLIISNKEFYADFFHKIIRMGYEYFLIPMKRKLEKFIYKSKNVTLESCKINNENGTDNFEYNFKIYFYLFSLHSQILYYKFSFFVIKYILYLKNQNENILYFLPINFIEFPFSLFQLLRRIHSTIFTDNNFRNEINQTSIYFKNDDYIESILEFYLYLFSDEKIKNPSIKESLLKKVISFTDDVFIEIFEKKNFLFEYLIKGLVNNMKNDSLSILSCKVLLKFINPICFGNEEQINIKSNSMKLIENYLKSSDTLLEDFMNNYFKFLNKIMTQYSFYLSDLNEKFGNNFHNDFPRKFILLQQLSVYYNLMCDLLKLTEFFIYISHDSFLKTDSLIYYNFIEVLKILNFRILPKNELDILMKVSEELKNNPNESSKKNISIQNIAFCIIGIFLKLNSYKNNENYNKFINELSNISDLDFQSFIYLISILNKENLPIEKQNGINEFNEYILSLEKNKKNEGFTNEQLDKFIEKGILCIICYNRIINLQFIPCHHNSCEECFIKYKKDKNVCFICHSRIENTEKIIIDLKDLE